MIGYEMGSSSSKVCILVDTFFGGEFRAWMSTWQHFFARGVLRRSTFFGCNAL